MEQADRDDGRDRLRQDDRAEDPERARAVDHRRLVEVARDRHEVLAQQEDVVGVGEEVRDDQRQPRPVPAELGEDHVGRDEGHLERQDDRRDQDDEQDVLDREAEAGEAVGDDDARDTAPIVLRTAIAAVLNSSRGKFSCDQAVVKFANSGANVQAWVSVRQWPCQTIGVAAGSAGSTKVLCLATLRDQHQLLGRPVDRDFVDRVLLALVGRRSAAPPDRSVRRASTPGPAAGTPSSPCTAAAAGTALTRSIANMNREALPRNCR